MQNIDLVHGCTVDDRACSWYTPSTQYHVRSIIKMFGIFLKHRSYICYGGLMVAHYLGSVQQPLVFPRLTTFAMAM